MTHPRCWYLMLVCGLLPVMGQTSALPTGEPMDWIQANSRLLHVADGIEAANLDVQQAQDLERASRFLRLPEVNAAVIRMDIQKTVDIPLDGVTHLLPISLPIPPGQEVEVRARERLTRPVINALLPLYTGGLIPAAQGAARADTAVAQAELVNQRQHQQLQLVQAYFGQQLAQKVVEVREQASAGLAMHLEQASALEKAGMVTHAQWLQVEVARDRAEREAIQARNELASTMHTLSSLLRTDEPILPRSPLFVISELPASLAEITIQADQRHPEVRRLEALEVKARNGLKAEQAKLKPQIFAFGQYDFRRQDALLIEPDWVFGIGLRYNLVSPTMRPLHVRAARAQLERAGAGVAEAKNMVQIGANQAWYALDSSRERFLLMDSALAQAKENLRLQDLSWREGMATSLDVIDAQISLAAVKVEQAQAAYQFTVALAQLLQFGARLDEFDDYRRSADKVLQ